MSALPRWEPDGPTSCCLETVALAAATVVLITAVTVRASRRRFCRRSK